MDRTKLPASYLWPNWITLILAVWLFISPWILDVPQAGAWVWNAWVVGVIMAALSIMALSRLAEWEDWVNLALGVWLFFSPWIFAVAFANVAWNFYLVGLLVAIVAIWGIVAARSAPPARYTASSKLPPGGYR